MPPTVQATPGTLRLRKVRPTARKPRRLLKEFLRKIIFGSGFGGRIVKGAVDGFRQGLLVKILFRCAYCIAWTKACLAVTFPELSIDFPQLPSNKIASLSIHPDQGRGKCSYVVVPKTGYNWGNATNGISKSSCPIEIPCQLQCSNDPSVVEVQTAAIVFILGLSYIVYMYVYCNAHISSSQLMCGTRLRESGCSLFTSL